MMTYSVAKPRMLEESDFPTLLKWWEFWKFAAPAKEFLPDNGTCGIMLEDQFGRPLCAGFIYFTNSQACWLEFIVSSPDVKDKAKRKWMLQKLIGFLSQFAEEEGARWIFTSVKNKSLAERFGECGFTTGSQGTTEMIKQL